MVKMIATKPLTYDMKTVEAGAEFEVADQYVGTLVSLGRATVKGKTTKVAATTTKPPAEEPAAESENKATYKSRRLKSEDDA